MQLELLKVIFEGSRNKTYLRQYQQDLSIQPCTWLGEFE